MAPGQSNWKEVFKYEWLRFLNSDIFLRVLRIWNNIPGPRVRLVGMCWVFFPILKPFLSENSQEAKLGHRLSGTRVFTRVFPHPLILNVEALFQHLGLEYKIHGWFPTAIRFERFGPLKKPMVFQGCRTFNFSASGRTKTWTFHGMPSIFFRRLRFVGGWFWVRKSFDFSWKSSWKAFETRIGVLKGSETGLSWTMCFFVWHVLWMHYDKRAPIWDIR